MNATPDRKAVVSSFGTSIRIVWAPVPSPAPAREDDLRAGSLRGRIVFGRELKRKFRLKYLSNLA